ncbi:MAG: nuclease-related domain-containing protein [Promethearchaeota archaeon]
MAKIIGEPDCTETIKFILVKYGIENNYSFGDLKDFNVYYKEILNKKDLDKKIELESFLDYFKDLYKGAIGEEKVISILKTLPENYYVLNEIQIRLTKSVLWKKHLEYVKSAQIDHIVIGETGIFLIETKNWEDMNIITVHKSPHKQIDRAGMLFWLAQKRKFGKPYKTYNLVVTLKELPKYHYKFVYQLAIKNVNRFILSRNLILNGKQIENIKNWLDNLRIINPKSSYRIP